MLEFEEKERCAQMFFLYDYIYCPSPLSTPFFVFVLLAWLFGVLCRANNKEGPLRHATLGSAFS